ncbi:penicillin acylase family protein [Actinoalloteichus caeruleus]|uniref:penicillin acylase family protein n=1 Tax=Actinoalloteichus cyanogriseus TaxID=2893586 RepID=UPI00068DA99D|nr:penicillin acylase family protein [Actinoalloteichus caeruleus]
MRIPSTGRDPAARWRRRTTAVALVALLPVTASGAADGEERAGTTVTLPGLSEEVEILVDEWGIPHIFAANTDDLYLAQGFNAARDRLFQIDLWRKRGLGELSSDLGPDYVEQDRAARLFLYDGDMEAEWASYGPDAERTVTAFVTGINAYVDWLEENPDQLPPEFAELGYEPSRWAPEDVVRIRSHGLTRNLTSEVARARVACAEGTDADLVRRGLEPDWTTEVPDGLDPCAIGDEVLDTFRLATSGVAFSDGEVRVLEAEDPTVVGSNNWVVAPERTSTGRPILANDPHRAYSAPALRYVTHLSAPGLDVIGAGEPALPGVSIGHNGTAAFGLTIFSIDQEDLYVYELDPADHDRYRYGDGWERVEVEEQRIEVAGEDAVPVETRHTRHGPLIHVDEDRDLGYAVRTAWSEPGMSPYLGSLAYQGARSFDEFEEAMRTWGAPTENQVYADVSGEIGWVPGGLAPERSGYDGLLPVPGDGRYEWTGFHDGAELPRSRNPAEGYVATANEMNLPPDFPHEEYGLGYEWTNPFRFQRITEVLAQDTDHGLADSAALQLDQLSLPARRITALLPGLEPEDAITSRARDLLVGWDHVETADSGPAALFEVWLSRHLGPEFVRLAAPEAAEIIEQPDTLVLVEELENPGRWLDQEERDELLLTTLRAAYRETGELLGGNDRRWEWGRLQHTLFAHPVGRGGAEDDPASLDVGPFPRGGSKDTVNQSSYRVSDFRQTNGPSFRMVLDVGEWDSSLVINGPGQSGDPDSPHYRDHAEPWRDGEFVPLLYSRAEIERHVGERIVLLPG